MKSKLKKLQPRLSMHIEPPDNRKKWFGYQILLGTFLALVGISAWTAVSVALLLSIPVTAAKMVLRLIS